MGPRLGVWLLLLPAALLLHEERSRAAAKVSPGRPGYPASGPAPRARRAAPLSLARAFRPPLRGRACRGQVYSSGRSSLMIPVG